jgi:hypothetical protein
MADDDDYQLEPPPLSAWAATVGMWTGPIGKTELLTLPAQFRFNPSFSQLPIA